ncbi:AMP-binding protein [Nonomuraea sp. NPDC049152]|uniref:AMP-binding protein n=1 Tax=Nonomuraea sp. NPDC049152 TaxID=3154350 RepID=UPI00340C0D6B
MWRNPSHPDRPLRALVLPPGPRLFEAVAAALSGEGPAVLPLSPDHADAALRALRPSEIETVDGVRQAAGPGVPADVAVVIATSGSTGAPKGVMLTAAALKASATASLRRLEASPGQRWLCCLPPSHVSGLQVLTRALLSGTEPIIHDRFDPEAVAGSGAEHVSLVPTQLHRLVERGADLGAFATILLGGAAPRPGLVEAARASGARIVTTYGSSETSGGCVYNGQPLDNVDLKIREDGRILVAGPVLFSGYRSVEGSRSSDGSRSGHGYPFGGGSHSDDRTPFADGSRSGGGPAQGGWFVTSDLGTIEDGRLRVLGRADDVINTGGEKVVAASVASVLALHPAVADVAVVGCPHPEWGEAVVAVVVPTDPGNPPTLDQLRAYSRDRLPAYAAPRELRLLSALPLLPNGKTDLAALRTGT